MKRSEIRAFGMLLCSTCGIRKPLMLQGMISCLQDICTFYFPFTYNVAFQYLFIFFKFEKSKRPRNNICVVCRREHL